MDFSWFHSFTCYFSIVLSTTMAGRNVPLKYDLCNRMPQLAICQSANQKPPPATVSPPLPPTIPPVHYNIRQMTTDQYCAAYQSYFTYYCQNAPAVASNKNTNAMAFCLSFPLTCKNAGGTTTTTSSSQKPTEIFTRQEKTAEQSVLELCQKFQANAKKYCNQYGNEADQNYRSQCDMYRSHCPNFTGFERVAPKTLAKVQEMCQSYKRMAEQHCIGYEITDLRPYCNIYRVYCLGKKPFPNIEGNVGITHSNFGLVGIPFYPFNPQGTIAGGKRTDVTFGDWGANVATKTGITDFFEGSRHVVANWQRGQYGGGRSFKIPFIGLGGYNTKGVSLSGIINPADIPTMLAGGVPQGRPLSGLGGIPMALGQPFQPPFSNEGQESNSAPGGGGAMNLNSLWPRLTERSNKNNNGGSVALADAPSTINSSGTNDIWSRLKFRKKH